MAGNAYTEIIIGKDYESYMFISSGKDVINKIVKFQLMSEAEQLYNLVLCTVISDGSEDCTTASRNGDMDAVLETTAQAAKLFSDRYPQRKFFLTGSTPARTRQYQIRVLQFYDLINEIFKIEGVAQKGFKIYNREPFKAGINYDGFVFTRKQV